MNKTRRIGAVLAMATATIGMTSASAIAPATADPRGPEPVSTWLRPVRAHSDTWIDVNWRTSQRICDASVRYYSQDVDIDYRGNRRSATFSRGVSLFPGRTDYTRIQVNPDVDRSGSAKLRAVITYDTCGRRARPETRSFTLTLPVQRDNDGRPGRPGRPGDDDRPGRPGDDDRPGRPGDDDRPGRPGDDDRPGRPGNDDRPGRPGNDDNQGRPGSNDRPARPTASPTAAAPTTTPTTAPTTTPVTVPTTTAPVATPTASATLPPPVQQGGTGQRGHHGQR